MAIAHPAAALRIAAQPLTGDPRDYDSLLARIGDCRLVLLGESTHGSHEFYRMRAEITKRLLTEKGFHALAVEADWPDAHRVDRWVKGRGDDADAERALGSFVRFPRWMWRNADVLDFVGWLRDFNESRRGPAAGGVPIGFYGLDLYSLQASLSAVLTYLDKADPEAAKRARARYACFDRYGDDTQLYGLATSLGLEASCEKEVVAQLMEMQERTLAAIASATGGDDDAFAVEQNARLVANAEAYYRAVVQGHDTSWNVRDEHMADTIDVLLAHLGTRGIAHPKIVVWEHNSHIGDARATRMGAMSRWNVGQLVRERHGILDTALVGFTTYEGTVTAASDWDEPAERLRVRPGIDGSWEALFHEVDIPRFSLITDEDTVSHVLRASRPERAIGVVYRPGTERLSHYFDAWIGKQFDAIVHIDRTRAVEPLERSVEWRQPDLPETFPFAV